MGAKDESAHSRRSFLLKSGTSKVVSMTLPVRAGAVPTAIRS
jgi:hypothetical protein